ncbi:MAG: ferritin [Acidobacteria bacterium]|nr:MAG: ferritin [Acidobacteriota bacterium]
MPSKKIESALNQQIQSEFYSAYLYLSMSAYCQEIHLDGFAHWLQAQSKEEIAHAMRLYNYLDNRGGRVILQAIDRPPENFKSPRRMFEQILKSEQEISKAIHKLYKLAQDEKDYPTEVELQWFIKEQVEEEKTAGDILHKLTLVGDQPATLLMMDHHLGSRE